MSDSTNLQLPYLQASQAQKHVTVNDGTRLLDALVMLAVENKDLTTPPGSPADGSRYIPASGATGAWATWDLNIAYYTDGAWAKIVPREGFLAYVRDEDSFYVYDGSAWNAFGGGGGGSTTLTGDVTGSGTGTIATTIAGNAVSNAKLRDSAALSVIGNSTNATADPADIAAGTDGHVLRRSGTALGFGTVATAGIADQAVTYGKIQNVSATDRVLGRATAGAGVVEEIACSSAGRALIDDADAAAQRTTLGLGSIATHATSEYAATGNNLSDLASASTARSNLGLANANAAVIEFVIDGAGSTITTGMKGYLELPFACTINAATLLANQSGSIVVDIYKCSYAQFDAGSTHPVSGDKITSATPPTISSATKAQDTTLASWTTSVSAGDILAFNVNSVTSIQRATLSLKVTKS